MKHKLPLLGTTIVIGAVLILSGCDSVEPNECKHENLEPTVIASTCEKGGYTTHTCTDCSYSYQSEQTAPLGHTLTDTVVPPTCDTKGYTKHECSVCGLSYQTDLVKPLSHDLTETVTAPTCEAEGYTTYTCKRCNLSYQADLTKPNGHTFTEVTTAPTCSEQGYVTHTCSTCTFSYESDFTAPLGHTLSASLLYPTRTQNGSLRKHCHCGYEYTNPLIYSDIFPGGTVSNTEALAKGIDVSIYQHVKIGETYQPLNWEAIKEAGLDFAILKAGSTPRTVGEVEKGGIEPVFEMDYRDAREAGLELGVYFYSYATTVEQVEADARVLIGWLEGKQFEYPIYFDLEDPSLVSLGQDTLTEMCVTFISALQANGYYGALYTNNQWLKQNLHENLLKGAFDIWYARYPENRKNADNPLPVSADYTWNADSYGPQLGMWQYTDYGIIEGIDESIKFDFNYVFRDYPALIKKFGYNGFPTKL